MREMLLLQQEFDQLDEMIAMCLGTEVNYEALKH